ncbi:MAG TPA: bifunctional glutamate N-acetyltransferase/amino-acid acetyltransferase ArgJ [Firmicutes bacterium]|jgi:glutamate N-acetyltransferase/amino-acid N-acetyltransferase|nr:bifunctional glutamate N-acetyltransferase/amino-acid acetyltransferase ArgJ [Bacillota bacterium]
MEIELKKIEGGITAISGVKAAGISSGLKKNSGKDLALVYLPYPAPCAGVFTTNAFKAAPLQVTEKRLKDPVRALIVNSGNANACTGDRGLEDARETARIVANCLKLRPEEVLVSSTGVIGQYLPMEKIAPGIEKAVSALSPSGGGDAARAIMTTDTFPKERAYLVSPRGKEHLSFKIAGMAKGAGMICPDMATMLAFLFTDLPLEKGFLQDALREAVRRSFNVISVDGDTSTNDMALLFSCGGAKKLPENDENILKEAFRQGLLHLCRQLAIDLVRDGEGASKVIHLTVKGASDYASARKIARAVLNSPLVKTAFFGEDANWGRIITAMGYSGVDFKPHLVDVFLGDLQVAAAGKGLAFDEERAREILHKTEIYVLVRLHMGNEELAAWGCDLSYDYIKINSSYRS